MPSTASSALSCCSSRYCPGHEGDWSLVQVALTDITARKKAEAYLEYLGKHDVLTKLHNRAFYMDELNRLERKSLRPVSAIVIDLNGLKDANDQRGARRRRRAAAPAWRSSKWCRLDAQSRRADRRRRVCGT